MWDQVARQHVYGRSRVAEETPLKDQDRFLIVVGQGTGKPVRENLRDVLVRLETHPAHDSLISVAQHQPALERKLTRAITHLRRSLSADGRPSSDEIIRGILALCRILPVVQDDLRTYARLLLDNRVLAEKQSAIAAFDTLETLFGLAGQNRTSYDVAALRQHLHGRRYVLMAPRSIAADVGRLSATTARLITNESRPIKAPEHDIVVVREIVPKIIPAARIRNVAIRIPKGALPDKGAALVVSRGTPDRSSPRDSRPRLRCPEA